ncbi:MAG: HNH endonuclease [Streptosporangiales bacterium]
MPSLHRGHGRIGQPWLRITADIRARRHPCWLCGQPIDYTLPATHPLSFTVDHEIPLTAAPWLAHDRSNLKAAHRRCNGRKGDGSRRDRTPQRSSRRSRRW